MAKRKPSMQPPQTRHKQKSTLSQHDRRLRLLNKNDRRFETQGLETRIAQVPLVGSNAMDRNQFVVRPYQENRLDRSRPSSNDPTDEPDHQYR